ncbi:MAG: hypothetical protein KKF30_07880 [Proteobacteria bacterium]|nr:hypothetical protein [Pseudomonadota bacterium]MBU4469954.1 hypothetical protein [Pseudomonadota bacterium]MCG2753716.1 hypothetical protein [Desulfobacteraceae bacterium]
MIRAKIESPDPMLITRFGSVELDCILNNLLTQKRSLFLRFEDRLRGSRFKKKYENKVKHKMNQNAGVFPVNSETLDRFVELILGELVHIDVLASWRLEEKYLFSYFNDFMETIALEDLPPFHHKNPWSEALKGMNVLVVHPFKNTILKQYSVHEKLFNDNRVLPEFNLQVFRAVQSIGMCSGPNAEKKEKFQDWFDALKYMEDEIVKIDFEIAIIGCGAYGMPLASSIKRMNKKAIHLGGTTQCLFGIKGKRWETEYNYDKIYYNDYWVRPDEEEIPEGFQKVENGCYW